MWQGEEQKGRGRRNSLSLLELGLCLLPLGCWSSWFSGLWPWSKLHDRLFWFCSLQTPGCGTSWPPRLCESIPISNLLCSCVLPSGSVSLETLDTYTAVATRMGWQSEPSLPKPAAVLQSKVPSPVWNSLMVMIAHRYSLSNSPCPRHPLGTLFHSNNAL
jgi:hypothetical protein